MKTLLFALLLIPFLGAGQTSPGPFKKANAIIVKTQDSPEVAFKKIAQLLVANSFGIASSDKYLGIITTTPRDAAGNRIALNVSIEGDSASTIIVRGTRNFVAMQPYLGTTSDYPIEYINKGSLHPRDVWALMQKVAISYPNAVILYEKR